MNEDRAVLLYGSHARGDADAISDIDVLVVGSAAPSPCEIAGLLPKSYNGPLHISHYRWGEFSAMSEYGSLFLHHIATEAKAIRYDGDAERRTWDLLGSLPQYQFAARDLYAFHVTVRDAEKGLRAGLPPCFELAVLGGVARHASVLACYVAGSPTFGRKSIARATELLNMRDAQGVLEFAHRFRLFEEGQCDRPGEVSLAAAEHVVRLLSLFLCRLGEAMHANAA